MEQKTMIQYEHELGEKFIEEATRGNVKSEPEVNTSDFDPSKPFEVTFGGGKWASTSNCGILREIHKYHFVGFDETGHPVVQHGGGFDVAQGIRNVQPEFDSTMLLAGQYMRVDDNHYPQYKDEVICRTDENHLVWVNGLIVFREGATKLKGRRVTVDLIVREI